MADATGLREYKGAAVASALSAGISNSIASFAISPITNWPTGGANGNFTLVIDQGLSSEESILCSAQTAGTITVVTRGYDGTAAVSHTIGAIVLHVPSAIDFSEANWIANTHSQTSKTTPVGADELPLFDSAATFGLKKVTLTNLNTFIGKDYAASTVSANQAVVAFNEYFVNTVAGAYTLTMPASATLGDEIKVYDAANNAATNNITMNSNGLKINGSVQNFVINVNGSMFRLKYTGATYGWMVS